MGNKVLLLVDENKFIAFAGTEDGVYIESERLSLDIDDIEQAKADAEAYLEEVKKEYEECIYDLVFAYVNKDEDMPHKFESQALIDAIKLSVKAKEFLDNDYLVKKYAIGEK